MKKETKKLSSKEKAIRLIIIIAAMAVILLILNSLDFSGLKEDEETDDFPEVTERYLGDHHFSEPDYEEDIMLDKNYLSKDRSMIYIENGEGNRILFGTEYSYNGRFCEFFYDYFGYLIEGNVNKINSMLSDRYKETKGEYEKFTCQKIYSAIIEREEFSVIEEGDYRGYTRAVYKVSYQIYDNDGTFRRDMMYDEVVPLRFELLDDGKEIKLNSIGRYINVNPQKNKSIAKYVIPLVLGIISIITIVIALISRSLYSLPVPIFSLFAFISSMLGASVTVQIIIFALFVPALSAIITIRILKKRQTA